MNNLDTMQLLGIALTIIMFSVIGLSSGKLIKTKSDYYVGGQRFGTLSIGGTSAGLYIGGGAVIGAAQLAFNHGFSGMYFSIGCCVALALSGLVFSARIRKSGMQTVQEMVNQEFGHRAAMLATVLGLLAFYINCITQFFSGISLITSLFPVSDFAASVVTAILILVCVYMGGFLGMSLINVVKSAILMGTIIISAIFILHTTDGLSLMMGAVPETHFSLFPRGMGTDLNNFASAALGIIATQTTIQVIFSAKDDKSCRNGLLIGGGLLIIVGACCVLIGMYMRMIAPEIDSIQAFPMFVLMHTHGFIGGMVIATTLIAVATAGVSQVLAIASILLNNIYTPMRPNATTKQQLRFSRNIILAVPAITIVIVNSGIDNAVLDYNFLSMGLRCVVLLLPMCASLFFPGKVSARFAMAGIVIGPVSLLLCKYVLPIPMETLFFGLIVTTIVMLMGAADKKRSMEASAD